MQSLIKSSTSNRQTYTSRKIPLEGANAGKDDRSTSQLELNTPTQPTMSFNTNWSRTCSCGKACKNSEDLRFTVQRWSDHQPQICYNMQGKFVRRRRNWIRKNTEQCLQASDEREEHIDRTEREKGRYWGWIIRREKTESKTASKYRKYIINAVWSTHKIGKLRGDLRRLTASYKKRNRSR